MGVAAEVIADLKKSPPSRRPAPGGGSQFHPEDGTVRPIPKREQPAAQKPRPLARASDLHAD